MDKVFAIFERGMDMECDDWMLHSLYETRKSAWLEMVKLKEAQIKKTDYEYCLEEEIVND